MKVRRKGHREQISEPTNETTEHFACSGLTWILAMPLLAIGSTDNHLPIHILKHRSAVLRKVGTWTRTAQLKLDTGTDQLSASDVNSLEFIPFGGAPSAVS